MSASGTIYLTMSALIYTIITTILFQRKKKINKLENKIFTKLLILSILSMVFELAIVFTINISIISSIIQKIFLVFIILWLSRFIDYTFVITVFDAKKSDLDNFEKYKKIYYIFLVINLLCCLEILLLPIYFNDIGNAKYTSGPSVNMVFAITGIYLLTILVLLVTHFKKIKQKNCLPIIVLFVLLIVCAIIQKSNPQVLLTNTVFGLIIYLMYNTIENPDLKLIAQLELAKQSAEKANNAKSDFLSSMSHEIRTPLNAIVGSIELLKDEENLSEDGREALKDLNTASNSLLEIGTGILNISQIESGKIDLIEKEYSPVETFDELYNLLKGRIGNKSIDFTTNYADDLPKKLYGDKAKIKEIVTNLLTNAIKYTDEGKINLAVKCINNKDTCKLIISVSDTGRGIRKEVMDKLFEKFTRDADVTDSTIDGVGLGLAITKSLVEIIGGTITVNSVVGKGSVFTVVFLQKIVDDAVENIPQQEKIIEQSNSSNNNYKILIVDDNNMNLNIEKNHLKHYGLDCDTCLSGELAIEKITSGIRYDLILMDDMMPSMSGTDTMRKLKYEMNFTNPIIVITANATTEAKEQYLNAGFDEFISKPVKREDLYKIVIRYLQK